MDNYRLIIVAVIITSDFVLHVQCFDGLLNQDGNINNSSLDNDTHENSTHISHTGHRYPVVSMNFAHVSFPYIITAVIICASLAKIGFHVNNKLSSIFPESCLLIVIGIIVGIIFYFSNVNSYELDSNTFFLYLLPPIILEAGYFMPPRLFIDNLGTILLFAVIATLWNTILIGLSIWGLSFTSVFQTGEISILHCLVFSSLLAAVDPVAVLAVFEEIQVNEVLYIVVFGESLLNDGVTVVLYHMFEIYSEIGENNIIAVDIIAGLGSFFIVGLGGTLVGFIIGFLAAFITRFTKHVRVIEPMLVFVMGYLSYLTAEMFHLSGILACVFCGMSMKKYVEKNISQKSHTTVKYFMKMMASISETIIFMFLGISTVTHNHHWDTGFIIMTLIFCLVYRAIGVVIFSWGINKVRLIPLSGVDQFIMAFGGLRGAIAFSLVILLNQDIFPNKKLFITTTVVVVFFTVFVQGSTIKPLVNILRVKKADKRKPTMNEKLFERSFDHLMAGIEDITGNHGHHDLRERYQRLDKGFIQPLLVRDKAKINRGRSIVNVFQKLEERDAHDFLRRNSSFNLNDQYLKSNELSGNLSVANLVSHYFKQSNTTNGSTLKIPDTGSSAPYSIPMPDNNSNTCLDMRSLETHSSPKIYRDHSSVRHLLEDNLFKPRSKFINQQRHMLPETTNHSPFHHKARLHLRHLISQKKSKESHKKSNNKGTFQNNNTPMVNDPQKPRKNVSFKEVTIQIDSPSPDAVKEREDDTESEDGIVFTVSDKPDSESVTTPMEKDIATVAETMLPWRQCNTAPTMVSNHHSLPNFGDLIPQKLPTWLEPQEKTMLISSSNKMDNSYKPTIGGNINYALDDSVFESDTGVHIESSAQNNVNVAVRNSDTAKIPPNVVKKELFDPEKLANHNLQTETCVKTSAVPKDQQDQEEQCEEDPMSLPLPWKSEAVEECELSHIPEAESPQIALSYQLKPLPPSDQLKIDVDNSDIHVKLDEVSPILPPPWKNVASLEGGEETGIQSSTPAADGIHVKTEVEDDEDIADDLVTEGVTSGENSHTDSIRAPWRQLSEVSLDRIRSPSVAATLDSMRPHPSTHSFIISEAESHHSQHIIHTHNLIEKPSHLYYGNGHVDHGDSNDSETDLGLDLVDSDQFVASWILGCEPDYDLPIHDSEHQQHHQSDESHHDSSALSVGDISPRTEPFPLTMLGKAELFTLASPGKTKLLPKSINAGDNMKGDHDFKEDNTTTKL